MVMPRWKAVELGPVLVEVVLGPKASTYSTRAEELGKACCRVPGVNIESKAIPAEANDSLDNEEP
jgi:hypothetical protein